MLVEVISSFSKGKFTQELGCIINPMTDVVSKESNNAAGRPNALDASGRRTSSTDTRVGPIITEKDNIQAANEVNNLLSRYPASTNKALNAATEANDDNVVNPTKQPANIGGREVDLTQANAALAARARDNAATNAQLRLLGRSAGGNTLDRPRGGA